MILKKRQKAAPPAMDTNAIIEARSVVKIYDTGTSKLHALKSIDFSVSRGEMVAVMGPSGCGKTTLLNCLSGLDSVNDGQIWLEGQDLAEMGDKKRTDLPGTTYGVHLPGVQPVAGAEFRRKR